MVLRKKMVNNMSANIMLNVDFMAPYHDTKVTFAHGHAGANM